MVAQMNRWLFWPWLALAVLWVIYGFYLVWDVLEIEGDVLSAAVFLAVLITPVLVLYGLLLLLNQGLAEVFKDFHRDM